MDGFGHRFYGAGPNFLQDLNQYHEKYEKFTDKLYKFLYRKKADREQGMPGKDSAKQSMTFNTQPSTM